MCNKGKDMNNSQFYITLVKTDWLDVRRAACSWGGQSGRRTLASRRRLDGD
jgi:cyclophilin family peptidyl-prolyl cis-trans isomerase